MPDVFTKAKRSQVMSRIRGRGNKETEVALLRLFRRQGITGWRRHLPVFGRPDFVFSRLKLAVFVDGCFWHNARNTRTFPGIIARFGSASSSRITGGTGWLAVRFEREAGAFFGFGSTSFHGETKRDCFGGFSRRWRFKIAATKNVMTASVALPVAAVTPHPPVLGAPASAGFRMTTTGGFSGR